MSLPVGLSTVTVTASALRPDGSGLIGTITFRPPATLVSSTYDVEIAGPVTMQFTGDGVAKTATLVATDAAGVLPTGFTYTVEEAWTDAPARSYSISLPSANPSVNLADIAQVSTNTGSLPGISSFGTSLVTSATAAAARTALGVGPVQLMRGGCKMVPLGASIENLSSFVVKDANGYITNVSFGKDWPTYAMLLSAGRVVLERNQAIGGQTTQNFIDRFDTDVTPFAPNLVPLGSIENDIQQSVPIATQKANIKTLVAKCRAIGALPVLRTAMPHSATGVHLPTGVYNAWLKEYCAKEGLPLIDFWTVLVDPTTGFYRSSNPNLTADTVHPNEEGHFRLAQYWLQQMDPLLPPGAFMMPADANDTGQLLPTPCFLTGSAGTPTSWNAINGNPANTARSLVTDPLGYGNLSRHVHTGSSVATAIQTNTVNITTAQASPGDTLIIAGRYSSDSANCPVTCTVTITTDGTTPSLTRVPLSVMNHPITNGLYRMLLSIPAGFVRMQVLLSAGPGTGTVDFAYPVVRNLTREGTWPT